MAAGLALAGLGGCDDGSPGGVLIPPVLPPDDAVSAGGQLFATASVVGGYANGILVRHVDGRPIKVEGNPSHPASLGGTSAIGQAEVLGFYDPDRSRGLIRDGEPQSWSSLLTALAAKRAAIGQSHGEGFRILTGTSTSPTLARQIAALKQLYPGMQWHRWEPVSRDAVRAGAILAYGQPVELVPKLDAVDLLLTIDSDLLDAAPGHLRLARDFAARRNPTRTDRMNRAYAIEPTPTLTGVAADHRFIAGPGDLARIVPALAASVLGGNPVADMPGLFAPLVADLKAARGRGLIHAGPSQPAAVHALIHAMNEAPGGRGQTYDLIAPVEADPLDNAASMRGLIDDMNAGRVATLMVIHSNPVFTAPGFGAALAHVAASFTLAEGPTETAAKTKWSLPARHGFEDWSDARAYDGAVTLLQPQAQPLYDGISPHHLLALFAAPDEVNSRDVVRQTHGLDDQQWHDALAAGLVRGTKSTPSDVALKPVQRAVPAPTQQAITLLVRPDPHIRDGRYANNAWLQELPRPLTKLTWDNPLLVSPAIADRLKLVNGDRVTLANGAAEVTLPAWIMPGQAPDCITALLGFGRSNAGMVGNGVGVDVFPLTASSGPVALHKIGGRDVLACTGHHDTMFADAGDYVHQGTLAAFKADPGFLGKQTAQPREYNRDPTGPAAWGMSIDLNGCIGCNACVVACMAENNIPVVGKQQVIHEREMHWLRIDRYYEGSPEAPQVSFQPVLCQHCERAPCEIVCPVGATVHDEEGLNVMVYNRCVGTRFCSNNCPYKVRRFNYFAFAEEERRPAVARNPEVTVRARGVMEKCTFCLQRIAAARIDADAANRPVGADEVKTRAPTRGKQVLYGVMALGFRGTGRQWRHYHAVYGVLAAVMAPLVCSVHSIVGLDFAGAATVGWHSMGGITGLYLAALAADIHLHDTYFVIAHFHYIMVGGMVSAYFAALHYWWPKITGKMYPEMIARAAALLMFLVFNVTFFPQYILGYLGMPRRYHAYPPEFQVLNVLSSAGATILAAAYLLPLFYLTYSIFRGPRAPANPWASLGLEWQTPSPPFTKNFVVTPIVTEGPYAFPQHDTLDV